jgi:hypothetical protein
VYDLETSRIGAPYIYDISNLRVKVNENWRRRNNKELLQMFGDLDILSFVRISRLNWIGHVNRMDTKRKVNTVLTIILTEID